MRKFKYILLSQRKDKFGQHNGYNRTKVKIIRAKDRESAKKELDATLKGRPYKFVK